jgi:hypothetical protein
VKYDTPQADAKGAPPALDGDRVVLGTLLRMLIAPAIGAAAGLLLLRSIILPDIGLGSVQRIAALGQHLNEDLRPRPSVVFLGNSITREGVDATKVEDATGGRWHAQNLALSGCSVTELRILLPKLMQARPDVVVLPFQPQDIGRTDDVPIDKCYAYAYGGFVGAWPADWTRDSLPGVNQTGYNGLRSSLLQQQLHFRTAPLNVLNDKVRLMLREGSLRETAADNWTDPYEMVATVPENHLAVHARQVRHDIQALLWGGIGVGASEIRAVARQVRAGGATPVLVALPLRKLLRTGYEPGFDIHRYIDALKSLLEETARTEHGVYIDASDVLQPDDYADVLHPNAQGRARYSRFMGEQLSRLPAQPN